jgi:hypothetical protein
MTSQAAASALPADVVAVPDPDSRKAAAAVAYYEREVAAARLAAERAKDKVQKYEWLLDGVRLDLTNTGVELAAALDRLAQARALAEGGV